MTSEEKLKVFLLDFERAFLGFKAALEISTNTLDANLIDLIKNGQIQKFEICMELAWKTAKWYLEENNGIIVNSPMPAIKNLFIEDVITEDIYLSLHNMLKTRNYFSHLYKEEFFMALVPEFPLYIQPFESLLIALKKKC